MNDKDTAGGWEVDKYGKRFRKVGNCIEHEMEFSFPQTKKDPEKARRELQKAQEREAKRHTGKDCPFKNGINTECIKACALYGNTVCTLTAKETPPDNKTSGKDCPLNVYSKKCNEKCALYFNGCGIINIIKGLNAGKEN